MNKIILILLLNFPVLWSQNTLNGTYCSSFNTGYGSTCILFQKNGLFEYKTSECLGLSDFGKGRYTFTDSVITLYFGTQTNEFKSNIIIENQGISATDSVSFTFKFLDNYELPINAFLLEESKQFKNLNNQADKNGHLNLHRPKNGLMEKYKAFFLGYELFEFGLGNEQDKKITIILAPAPPDTISDKILKLKVMDFNDDILITDKGKFSKVRE